MHREPDPHRNIVFSCFRQARLRVNTITWHYTTAVALDSTEAVSGATSTANENLSTASGAIMPGIRAAPCAHGARQLPDCLLALRQRDRLHRVPPFQSAPGSRFEPFQLNELPIRKLALSSIEWRGI
jgi:hypothetical protein